MVGLFSLRSLVVAAAFSTTAVFAAPAPAEDALVVRGENTDASAPVEADVSRPDEHAVDNDSHWPIKLAIVQYIRNHGDGLPENQNKVETRDRHRDGGRSHRYRESGGRRRESGGRSHRERESGRRRESSRRESSRRSRGGRGGRYAPPSRNNTKDLFDEVDGAISDAFHELDKVIDKIADFLSSLGSSAWKDLKTMYKEMGRMWKIFNENGSLDERDCKTAVKFNAWLPDIVTGLQYSKFIAAVTPTAALYRPQISKAHDILQAHESDFDHLVQKLCGPYYIEPKHVLPGSGW